MEASRTEAIQHRSRKQEKVTVNDSKGYLFAKRTLDIAAATAGLIMLSPLFFILAILIKWEDPKGPVIFKQVRVGKDGKEFYMYKFRSMVNNAEDLLKDLLDKNEVSGLMFKMKDDPRVTKVGKFIRRTSLDELPQLVNVLKGEMSLVGPRPPLPREVADYNTYHKQRLLVKPGCTGVWQVSARNNVGFEEMVEMDLEYIKQRTILKDVLIIFSTIKIMVLSKAY
ncbi:sugar transferase [Niallia circulans]|uniref:sugar transferase n=1 Tax=Shouchella clausii TaxID=79880 RepID=UPI000BA53637|nr:sugar transferase [Shouchella clausii]PAD44024.1 multidrug MFS transporter [Bacillus sp. 7520-S]PAE98486.1 multidrug MFS transporter [Shouchella clausii]SPT78309.1 sugar transferase [Niallia circulans]